MHTRELREATFQHRENLLVLTFCTQADYTLLCHWFPPGVLPWEDLSRSQGSCMEHPATTSLCTHQEALAGHTQHHMTPTKPARRRKAICAPGAAGIATVCSLATLASEQACMLATGAPGQRDDVPCMLPGSHAARSAQTSLIASLDGHCLPDIATGPTRRVKQTWQQAQLPAEQADKRSNNTCRTFAYKLSCRRTGPGYPRRACCGNNDRWHSVRPAAAGSKTRREGTGLRSRCQWVDSRRPSAA